MTRTDTSRRCAGCEVVKPTVDYRHYRSGKWLCVSKFCTDCEAEGKRFKVKPGNPRAEVSGRDILNAIAAIEAEGYRATWQQVATRLKVTYDLVFNRVKELRQSGELPAAAPYQRTNTPDPRASMKQLKRWLDDNAIGTPEQTLTERLDELMGSDRTHKFLEYRATIKAQERAIERLHQEKRERYSDSYEFGKPVDKRTG